VSLSQGVKQPVREVDHSPPFSVEVKNAWSYASVPPVRLHGVVLSLKRRRGTPLPLRLTYDRVTNTKNIEITNDVSDSYQ
jgi:hypothetical protein